MIIIVEVVVTAAVGVVVAVVALPIIPSAGCFSFL